MDHLFSFLPAGYRWILLAILFLGTVAFALILTVQGKPLSGAVPGGILSYEFAWNQSRAQTILESWKTLYHILKKQLLLDFGFLIVYPLFLSLACAMLSDSPVNKMAVVGIFISWAIIVAGPLDAVENIALYRMINNGASNILAQVAGWCAGLKFLLVYASLGYILLQSLSLVIQKCVFSLK